MTMNKKLVERRKHKRFKVSKDAFVAHRPDYLKIGQVKDISMGGLAFTYIADEKPPNESFELDMFLASQDFYMQKVPFRTISDFEGQGITFSSIKIRRSGVQFGELTQSQVFDLEYFIENHTEGEGDV